MKNLRHLLGIVLLFLAGLIIIGLTRPGEWSAEATISIAAPPAQVYPYIAQLPNWRQWAVWFDHDPAMSVTFSGPESGVGTAYQWTGNHAVGAGSVCIESVDEGRGIGMRLSMSNGRFLALGSLLVDPAFGGSSRVTWELHGDLGVDPFARLNRGPLEHAVQGTLRDSLEKLKRMLEHRLGTSTPKIPPPP